MLTCWTAHVAPAMPRSGIFPTQPRTAPRNSDKGCNFTGDLKMQSLRTLFRPMGKLRSSSCFVRARSHFERSLACFAFVVPHIREQIQRKSSWRTKFALNETPLNFSKPEANFSAKHLMPCLGCTGRQACVRLVRVTKPIKAASRLAKACLVLLKASKGQASTVKLSGGDGGLG